ncbi:hypothetical protein ACJX0J_029918, partial [Zea mays]
IRATFPRSAQIEIQMQNHVYNLFIDYIFVMNSALVQGATNCEVFSILFLFSISCAVLAHATYATQKFLVTVNLFCYALVDEALPLSMFLLFFWSHILDNVLCFLVSGTILEIINTICEVFSILFLFSISCAVLAHATYATQKFLVTVNLFCYALVDEALPLSMFLLFFWSHILEF